MKAFKMSAAVLIFGLTGSLAGATEYSFDCEKEILKYVSVTFATEKQDAGLQSIHHVVIKKSVYNGASGEMDIEAYAAFDEEGYLARRIFIGSDAILDKEMNVISCPSMYVKASYIDPLAE